MACARRATWKILALLIGAGFLLRLAIFAAAENALEVSEAIVGLMALDILEGSSLPFFFYGTSYNGGGALEAYLAAASFALVGPSAAALKLWILVLWLLAALLFADLCRRTLQRTPAILAVFFFSLGTPFFLEWSLKARGGFIETVLFSSLLLWLAAPPKALRERASLQYTAFGLTIGVGMWASEMLLAMIPCAAVWLAIGLPPQERKRAARQIGFAVLVGLLPLLFYNLNHDWEHLRSSVLYAVLQPSGGEPLSLTQLEVSAAFVLGHAWPLFGLLSVVAAARLVQRRGRDDAQLGLVALVHVILYLIAYWLSGERYLSVPPSRVLFSLYPSFALLFAYALDPPRRGGLAARAAVALAIASWTVSVSLAIYGWVASGEPREAGSWRGGWALTDGQALHRQLASLGVEQIYTAWWTAPPLILAQRSGQGVEPDAPQLQVDWTIPSEARRDDANAALVLHRDGSLAGQVGRALRRHGVAHQRLEWHGLVIFHGLPAGQIHQGLGIPAVFEQRDWPPEPKPPDGFN